MDKFSWFVLPFTIGFAYLLVWLVIMLASVWRNLSVIDRRKIYSGLFSLKTVKGIVEIFNEALLHRKIFKINPLLGWMHLSFAFGWLMLIIFGKIETLLFTGCWINPVWYPLFFKYFEPGNTSFPFNPLFKQLMDFWLLLILSGQMIAIFKRIHPQRAGIQIKTRHAPVNRLTLTILWFIFPMRFLAESTTAALHGGGGFLTGSVGFLLASIPELDLLSTVFWWVYSIALGLFFVMLPYSRYLHIPIEGFLILFRNWGVTDSNTMMRLETLACSACGLCLDVCPLSRSGIAGVQPVYFIERLREGKIQKSDLWKCLRCQRCAEICPVMVRSERLRDGLKQKSQSLKPQITADNQRQTRIMRTTVDVVLYSGCMGRQTPATRKAMNAILDAAGQSYAWIDQDDDLCCGRPLQLNGKREQAQQIKNVLLGQIHQFQFKLIVTTCPICYNMLTDSFPENTLMHHTQYIKMLVNQRVILLNEGSATLVYHDPCELSRGARVLTPPTDILALTGTVLLPTESGLSSNCCGGAIAALHLTDEERQRVSSTTTLALNTIKADYLITACPLCKKTLTRQCGTQVKDIAEQVAEALNTQKNDASGEIKLTNLKLSSTKRDYHHQTKPTSQI